MIGTLNQAIGHVSSWQFWSAALISIGIGLVVFFAVNACRVLAKIPLTGLADLTGVVTVADMSLYFSPSVTKNFVRSGAVQDALIKIAPVISGTDILILAVSIFVGEAIWSKRHREVFVAMRIFKGILFAWVLPLSWFVAHLAVWIL